MGKNRSKHANSPNGGNKPNLTLSIMDRFHIANDLINNGKFTNAKILLNEILLADPRHSESWFCSALIAEKEGLPQDAIRYLESALKIDPQSLKYLYTIGDIYYEQNYLDQGVRVFELIISIKPDDYNGYYNLAGFLHKQKKYEQSLLNYYKVLELHTDNINAIYNIGAILIDTKNYQNAVQYFQKVIESQPNSDDALNNLGFLYLELDDLKNAIEFLNKALSINSNNFNALNNLGKAYEKKSLFLEAIKCFDGVISLKPDYAEAYSNRGVALQELKQIDEAINCFDKAISLDPENAEANHNKSLILLLRGEFEKGWELYKWRWGISASSTERFHTKIPHWDGINSDNSLNVFLWAEQGIGDEIFYFGILKNFFKIDSRVIISADKRLHGIFKRSMPKVEFIDRKKIDTEFIESTIDFQAPMGDLGYFYSVNKIFDANQHKPFLQVNNFSSVGVEKRNHVFKGKILCGLSWKSANKDIGLSKSLNLIELAPLLLIDNVEFVSLQYGSTKDEIEYIQKIIGKKIHIMDELDIYNDIDGLLSLISDCDFVVTTSNITAHLTGSIGKKGMVLLPFSKGKIWYWHSGEGQSTWYPSLQLASQTQMNDWTYPIQKCKDWILEQL
jgi:tetratricopeptide (TPR) repeat protein